MANDGRGGSLAGRLGGLRRSVEVAKAAPPPLTGAPETPTPANTTAEPEPEAALVPPPLSDKLTLLVDVLVQAIQQAMKHDLDQFAKEAEGDPHAMAKRREKVAEMTRRHIESKRADGDGQLLSLNPDQVSRLAEAVASEVAGYGPIDVLLANNKISEVMVNGPKRIFYEHKGKLVLSPITFRDDAHVMAAVKRILDPIGRRVDTSQPLEDARLPDGSRVNVIIPPLALDGPTITIRKFPDKRLTIEDYLRSGSMSPQMATFLEGAVKAKLNVIVSGGTGSGKTTLLNLLSGFIPSDERIVTIEDAAELRLNQDHVVRLEARKANVEGKGEVAIRELVKNALRMRPDRIVVGECRSGEALDMLQAMNTGHDGSLTTLHANTPRDALSRLETLCLMSGVDLPQRALREQIVKAIDLVVQISRLRDGVRRVTYISELEGRMEGDVPVMQDIFLYDQRGYDEAGASIGEYKTRAHRPRCLRKFEEQGIGLPDDLFFEG